MDSENAWGLLAIAAVVFDVDIGQKIDALYPEDGHLLTELNKTTIAYLSLPHTNKYEDGDTQYCFRYRQQATPLRLEHDSSEPFHYGYVLFRQYKDESLQRGYFQKSIVILTKYPYLEAFEKSLRILGPLFFKIGSPSLEAIYNNLLHWPSPIEGTMMTLDIVGTSVSCNIPAVKFGFLHSDNFVGNGDGNIAAEIDTNNMESTPSLVDILSVPRPTNECSMYESVGLFSSFFGLENHLWNIWQIILTGENVLLVAPSARTCSLAVLALTSIISPIPFQGDYRPYFTIYEPDFQVIANSCANKNNAGTGNLILGTTNPFLMKALRYWDNILILGTKKVEDSTILTRKRIRGKQSFEEHLESSIGSELDYPLFLTRHTRYLQSNESVLRRLLPCLNIPSAMRGGENPSVCINNAVLRQHFYQLTENFLAPFHSHLSSEKLAIEEISTDPYSPPEKFLKPFNTEEFLAGLSKSKIPLPLKRLKWKRLYQRFILSTHFKSWLSLQQQKLLTKLRSIIYSIRKTISVEVLLNGSASNASELQRKIIKSIEEYSSNDIEDPDLLKAMLSHLKTIEALLTTRK